MPQIPFDQMPDHARVWIFAADRPLTADEQRTVLGETDTFLDGWAAHGTPLTNARDFRYDRFLFVAADEQQAGASGCSIDAMVRNLKTLEQQLDLTLLDHSAVLYRDDDGVQRVPRPDFAAMAQRGDVQTNTTVFNNTVATVGDIRRGAWETAAADSWHGTAFFG